MVSGVANSEPILAAIIQYYPTGSGLRRLRMAAALSAAVEDLVRDSTHSFELASERHPLTIAIQGVTTFPHHVRLTSLPCATDRP